MIKFRLILIAIAVMLSGSPAYADALRAAPIVSTDAAPPEIVILDANNDQWSAAAHKRLLPGTMTAENDAIHGGPPDLLPALWNKHKSALAYCYRQLQRQHRPTPQKCPDAGSG